MPAKLLEIRERRTTPRRCSNDPTNQDAVGGASKRDLRRASTAIRWIAISAPAVALALLHVLSAGADGFVGRVVKIVDARTVPHALRAGPRPAPPREWQQKIFHN